MQVQEASSQARAAAQDHTKHLQDETSNHMNIEFRSLLNGTKQEARDFAITVCNDQVKEQAMTTFRTMEASFNNQAVLQIKKLLLAARIDFESKLESFTKGQIALIKHAATERIQQAVHETWINQKNDALATIKAQAELNSKVLSAKIEQTIEGMFELPRKQHAEAIASLTRRSDELSAAIWKRVQMKLQKAWDEKECQMKSQASEEIGLKVRFHRSEMEIFVDKRIAAAVAYCNQSPSSTAPQNDTPSVTDQLPSEQIRLQDNLRLAISRLDSKNF